MESKIIWLTGLSGSGKTTLSNYISKSSLQKSLKSKKSMVTHLEKNKENKFTKKV